MANTEKDTSHSVTPYSLADFTAKCSTKSSIRVDDVDASLKAHLLNNKLWQIIFFSSLIIAYETCLLFVFYDDFINANRQEAIGFILLVSSPIVLFVSWIDGIKKRFRRIFLEQFAAANDYKYTVGGDISGTFGSIFRMPDNHTSTDLLSGNYRGDELRLFVDTWTLNSRSSLTTTVLEISIDNRLPNLLLLNKRTKLKYQGINYAFGIANRLSLEGDFDKFFTLYGNEENRVEALQIFKPEILRLMNDGTRKYTVEFVNNKIYIYVNGIINTTKDMNHLFTLAEKLTDKLKLFMNSVEKTEEITPSPVDIPQKVQTHMHTALAIGTIAISAAAVGILIISI
jgi:hypothetical protein